ncbi:hypothetical protein [Allobranchiibius sp. CTAmp26]|uniref:hypothetical protein n=1 Tax=Allobranchiibius sp. CTAmp26 TaxID=2815214 RepID=UPI001AA10049|nr:hypothetical protein [Allobranchiibius sp. CTAmp26]MBO1754836.1 hypothetical protein [Allobranchiibius sp. CTAmp26]
MLTSNVLQDARTFFEHRGTFGLEGTAMIKKGTGLELVVPRQNAHRDAHGNVNVEVPRGGQMDLALAVGPDDLYVARIHSHPGDAFHSAADDVNPVISFQGGISIVVPFFGLGLRRGLDACAVYQFCDGSWKELMAGPDRDRWIVAEEPS